MSKQKRCIVCKKPGKKNSITERWMFFLCEQHNVMVELDTIQELIDLARSLESNQDRLDFIEACEYFRDNV